MAVRAVACCMACSVLASGGEGGFDGSDLTEPALLLGLGEPVDEVGLDFFESGLLSRVNAKEGASDAGVFMRARGSEVVMYPGFRGVALIGYMPTPLREVGMSKRYPPEFRRKVLDLLKAGRTVRQVAFDLQISDQTIYNWREQELIDTGQKPGITSSDHTELVAARRRIAELEIFHNRRRRHSALGMLTPIEYEMLYPNVQSA